MNLVALTLLNALCTVQDKVSKQILWNKRLEIRDVQSVGKGRKGEQKRKTGRGEEGEKEGEEPEEERREELCI